MTRLAGEPLHLACRADHPLAGHAALSVRQLANERFVEVPEGWTARLLGEDAAFAGEGIPRRVVCEVGDWELFLELVSAGVGIGFAPVGLRYPVLTAPDSVLIPLEPGPDLLAEVVDRPASALHLEMPEGPAIAGRRVSAPRADLVDRTPMLAQAFDDGGAVSTYAGVRGGRWD